MDVKDFELMPDECYPSRRIWFGIYKCESSGTWNIYAKHKLLCRCMSKEIAEMIVRSLDHSAANTQ